MIVWSAGRQELTGRPLRGRSSLLGDMGLDAGVPLVLMLLAICDPPGDDETASRASRSGQPASGRAHVGGCVDQARRALQPSYWACTNARMLGLRQTEPTSEAGPEPDSHDREVPRLDSCGQG